MSGESTPSPSVTRVLETVIYGSDVDALASFYGETLGLRRIGDVDELGASLRLPDGGVLLVFDPALASRPGRTVPSHGTSGPGHVAFTVPSGQLEGWRDTLSTSGVEIEREVEWGNGSRSIYVRDPAGNSVELIEGDPWPP